MPATIAALNWAAPPVSGWVAATRQSILNSDARLDFCDDTEHENPLQTALAVPIGSDGLLARVPDRVGRAARHEDEAPRRNVDLAIAEPEGGLARPEVEGLIGVRMLVKRRRGLPR